MSEYAWNRKWSLKPRVCNWSGEKIPMFTSAYKGQRTIDGPGYSVIYVGWMSGNTYLLEKLKGDFQT